MNKTLVVVFFQFLSFQLFSQTKDLSEAYSLRYVDSAACFRKQLDIFAKQTTDEGKIISNSFLALTYLKFKDAQHAYHYLKANNQLNYARASDEAQSFYFYALYRYKFYIDEPFHEDLLKAFRLFEKTKNYEFSTYAATALSYLPEKVERQLMELALKYATLSNNNDALVEALLCKASYFQDVFESNGSETDKSQALKIFEQCVSVDSVNNLLQKGNEAKIYLNYANLLSICKYPVSRILPLTKKAIEISGKYNIMNIYRNTYGLLAMMLIQEHKLKDAENILLEGLHYMKNMPYSDTDSQIKFYELLKNISSQEKDYEKYYRYDQEYQNWKKKLDVENEKQFTNKAISKYELQNKDEAIGILSQKNKSKTILLLASILIVSLLAVVFRQYMKSQKTKHLLLESYNREITTQKEQAQKDLMNSILHLEKKNEILNSLKAKLLKQNKEKNTTIHASVFQSIDEGILVDDDFEKFKNNFNPIYPKFFNNLQQKANSQLTQLDLKYCAFILMRLSNKEIASQMNVEPKSIRMARYRIKQKLQLGKDEELDGFIHGLA